MIGLDSHNDVSGVLGQIKLSSLVPFLFFSSSDCDLHCTRMRKICDEDGLQAMPTE